MLQRRIGMICTRSGCAVCTRPRANSLSDRALRLTVGRKANRKSIASGGGRLRWQQALYAPADFQRTREDGAHRNETEELMPRHGSQARGCNAAAIAAVGRAAELAGCDACREIRGDRRRREREDAFIR